MPDAALCNILGMTDPTATSRSDHAEPAAAEESSSPGRAAEPDGLVESDLLVEEISIDGMCGVY